MNCRYEQYLKSSHWQRVRLTFWNEHEPVCVVCQKRGTPHDIHIHHRTYEHLGREEWGDLIPLCKEHHDVVHTLVNNGQATLWDAHLQLATDISTTDTGTVLPPETMLQVESYSKPFPLSSVLFYIEGESYSPQQLEQMASKMLWQAHHTSNTLLTKGQWSRCLTHEILSDSTPDPAFTRDRFGNHIDGMYWRTHPDGRAFVADPDIRRTLGCSFYDYASPSTTKTILPSSAPKQRKRKDPSPCIFPGCNRPGVRYPQAEGYLCQGHAQQRDSEIDLHPLRDPKLTAQQRQEIRELKAQSISLAELSRRFGVSANYIGRL